MSLARKPAVQNGLIALLVFIAAGIFLSQMAMYIDDTNYGTSNGLWKSRFFIDYMDGQIDYQNLNELSFVTNLYYFPVYATLLKALPFPQGMSLVMKMTIINAWFGAMALACFYLLIIQLTRNRGAALLATLFHLALGMFFSISTNSEDIVNAYAFYVMMALLLLRFLKTDKLLWLILASIACSIMWGFHWTMALPAIPAVILLLAWKHRVSIPTGVKYILVFLGINAAFVVINALTFGIPLEKVYWPGKAMDSGWLGWAWDKVFLLYTGFTFYIIGGRQFNGVGEFFEQWTVPGYPGHFIISSLVLITGVLFVVWFFRKKNNNRPTALFMLWLGLVFFLGQLMNVYELGTDLQFHIQPMMWLPVAGGLLLGYALKNWARGPLSYAMLTFIPIMLIAGLLYTNVNHYRMYYQGRDSVAIAKIKQLETELGDLQDSYFVTRGWDEFRNWAYASWGSDFRNRSLTVSEFLVDHPDESEADAVFRLDSIINSQLSMGKTVVAGPDIIDQPLWQLEETFSGFQAREKTRSMIMTVRENFAAQPYVIVESDTFYSLQPIGN